MHNIFRKNNNVLDQEMDEYFKIETNVINENKLIHKAIKRYGFIDNFKLDIKQIVLPLFFLLFLLPFFVSLLMSFLIASKSTYNFYYNISSILLGMIAFIWIVYNKFKVLNKKKIYIFFIAFPFMRIFLLIISTLVAILFKLDSNSNEYTTMTLAIELLNSIALLLIVCFFIRKNIVVKVWWKKSFSKRNLWVTFIIIAVGFGIFYLLQFVLNLIPNAISNNGSVSENQSSLIKMTNTNFGIVTLFISAVIVAPIFEEVIYRYFVSLFFNHSIWGYFCSTIYFAFLHVAANGDFVNIFPYFSLGIVNGFIYYYFRNLAPCIAIHFIGNLLSFILILTM